MSIINNKDLIPKYKPDTQVILEDSGYGLKSPDWIKTLIIEEFNIGSATEEGTFQAAVKVLDHLAEMGINGIWITPFFGGIHYYNYGPSTLGAQLVGTDDFDEGYKVVKNFVDEAHERNIRVFFDIVTWGINPEAPLIEEHPDWFDGYSEEYKGPLYNWKNKEFEKWFGDRVIDIVERTNVDGLRADGGVQFCGFDLYNRIRNHFHSKGKYLALFSENILDNNEFTFDFNEHSFNFFTRQEGRKFIEDWVNIYSGKKADIVGAVLEGKGIGTPTKIENSTDGYLRFYTSVVSCHDTPLYMAQGRPMSMIYASIISPFIPLWYIGEEWNNPYVLDGGWLYRNPIFWDKLEENREFYEKIKKAIRIRRMNPDIFEYFPKHLREANLCAVKTNVENALPAYARYRFGKGIICLANREEEILDFTIEIPFEDMEIGKSDVYYIKDLMTDELLHSGNREELQSIVLSVAPNDVRVIGISADNSL